MNAETPQFPRWLDAFTLDKPWKKAAWCLSHRDMLTDQEAFTAATICLWGECGPGGTVGLEKMFARMLLLMTGIRWGEHPLCDPVTKGIVNYETSKD